MLYEFNGMTIPIPDEVFFKLSDDELRDYLASSSGIHTENPFFDSILQDGIMTIKIDGFELPEDIKELPEGFVEEEE